MDLDSVPDFLALQKTPDIKVNLYSPSNAEGEGEGGATPWDTPQVGPLVMKREVSWGWGLKEYIPYTVEVPMQCLLYYLS